MPTLYNPERYDRFIEAVENGDTVRDACKTAQTAWRTVSRWITDNQEAGARYARARTVSAALWADAAVEAVREAKSKDDAPLARVRAEVYRWRAGVANPKEYGDKVDVTSNGERIVSGVIMLPPEDSVQPVTASTVTARLLTGGASLDSSVDAHVDVNAQQRTSVGEGVGGGDGTDTAE